MSEPSLWTLLQGHQRREPQTETFTHPTVPGFQKSVTFHRISRSERMSAEAEAAQLVQKHLMQGHPFVTEEDDPEGITPEGILEVMLLRWHQPEECRWNEMEWIALLGPVAEDLLPPIQEFSLRVDGLLGGDGAAPLAAANTGSSSGAAAPDSTPISSSDGTDSSAASSGEPGLVSTRAAA